MDIACPLCGTSPARSWHKDRGFQAVECRSCGLRRTWPPPTPEQLARFYAAGDYYETRGMGPDAAAPWVARARAILGGLPGQVARALDVGAGQGHLVAALRTLAVEADGVEPLAAGREAARRLHGIELLDGLPLAASASYDLVTLVHSLEHVHDPIATLAEARELLRAGGCVFVDVPHAGSVEYWRPQRRRELLALPGHLFHFTPATLTRLVERAGLEVFSVRLINPDALEWLFRLRERGQRRRKGTPSDTLPDPGVGSSTPAASGRGLRASWRGGLLPWLRAHLPGYRFELVARKPARTEAGQP